MDAARPSLANPPPACEEVEDWATMSDGYRIYTKSWKSTTVEPKAKIVVVHGFSDHCNAYSTFFRTLAARGLQVHSYDQRGWGHSIPAPTSRGLTGPTPLVLSDLSAILTPHLPSPTQPLPLFLLGHSAGGGIALTYAALGPPAILSQISGFLGESPLLALTPSTAASKLKILVGKLAGRFLPAYQVKQTFNSAVMSRDPEVCKSFENDELRHDYGTLEGMGAMLTRGEELVRGKVRVAGERKLWVGHGTGDQVTWSEASRKWVDEGKAAGADWTYRGYEGWYHKLHDEPGEDKYLFANDVADWILARTGPAPTAAGGATEGETKSRL
ncbi:MAG: hypothetical protein M1817_002751 [Caeruleum heppii]|nr:MAG: hypothetical protein M1817_002751 [Caeruleum heppii]